MASTFFGQTVDYYFDTLSSTYPTNFSLYGTGNRVTYGTTGATFDLSGTIDSDATRSTILCPAPVAETTGIVGFGFTVPTWVGTGNQEFPLCTLWDSAYNNTAFECSIAQGWSHTGENFFIDSWETGGYGLLNLSSAAMAGTVLWVSVVIATTGVLVRVYNRSTHLIIAQAQSTKTIANVLNVHFGPLTNHVAAPTGLTGLMTDVVADFSHSLSNLYGWDVVSVPDVPTGLTVSGATSSSLTVSWTAT